MLLLLTNSLDGSSDIICRLCEELSIPCFRLNIDLFAEYRFRWEADGFEIGDPYGRTVRSGEITAAYWRKPHFPGEAPPPRSGVSVSECEWAEAQVLYLVNEVANWCRSQGVLRLVEPRAERRVGKVLQMLMASRYFDVPKWQTGWGQALETGSRIVKSLDARLIDDGRFLYARSVDPARLDPRFPWLVQDVAPGTHDATVVFVCDECFGFRFDAPRHQGCEDWRKTINTEECIWSPWAVPQAIAASITSFMGALGLRFGRLDFVVGEGCLWFLEVNPNGQFGWLDGEELQIHRRVLESLFDPTASVY